MAARRHSGKAVFASRPAANFGWVMIVAAVILTISVGANARKNASANVACDSTILQTNPGALALRNQPSRSPANVIVVVPKIELVSHPPFWANSSAAVMKISLVTGEGADAKKFKDHPKLTFVLSPANGAFNTHSIDVLPGKSDSDPFTLTSNQEGAVEVSCAPAQNQPGLQILESEPTKVEFITFVDRIGIEPVAGESTINIGSRVRVFLCNASDLNKHIAPTTDVTVKLGSEFENGKLEKPEVKLTPQEYVQEVRYVGTRLGSDTITGLGFYFAKELNGQSERTILFPWFTFICGLAGTAIGAYIKFRIAPDNERLKNLLEAIVCGILICLFSIVYPKFTTLPEISDVTQPIVAFALSLIVAVLGPALFEKMLARLPA